MGKKKDKKNRGGTGSEFFDYQYGVGEAKHMMERYGIEGARSVKPDMRGPGDQNSNRSVKDVKKDIANAMMNDYDTRRTLEAAAMAGNKDAKRYAKKGIKGKNIQDAYGVMRDLKKEYVGGGGMGGAKNRAGLTYAAVKADREAQTAAYDKQYASQEMLNSKIDELKDRFKTMEEDSAKAAPEIVESDELKEARARLAGTDPASSSDSLYKTSTPRPEPTTAFRKENEGAPTTDTAKQGVQSYLEQYKKDVIAGGRIKEATTNNLNNAYNTVISSDI